MPKLSAAQTKKARAQVIATWGNRCYICGRTDRPLELDHRNGDPTFNPIDGSNWGVACGPCNTAKGPHRGASKRGLRMRGLLAAVVPGTNHKEGVPDKKNENRGEGEREYEGMAVRSMSAEMMRNMQCEPIFRSYAVTLVQQMGVVSLDDLVYAASERAGCVDQTGRRYLKKMCSMAGLLELFVNEGGAKMIRMKAQASPPVVLPAKTVQASGKPKDQGKPDGHRTILQAPGAGR